MEMATPNRLEPDEDALFCPHCGNDIDDDIGYEIEGVYKGSSFYLNRKVSLIQMLCGAVVQDGEFLSKPMARETFG